MCFEEWKETYIAALTAYAPHHKDSDRLSEREMKEAYDRKADPRFEAWQDAAHLCFDPTDFYE